MAVMKEVIHLKEKELQHMTAELEQANHKADTFDLELQKARHDRKKENRDLHGAGITKAYAELAQSKNSRNPHNTQYLSGRVP